MQLVDNVNEIGIVFSGTKGELAKRILILI